ncbi:hypothetical protein L6452_39320 [Arctium lappa]|uniref:Uncharacterized protein n=1 Tax=Arctium lappa TaxID=4217 RepID=A0ACB8XT44_ARCLA|nr:hypothetical protein L6452_39320 [Arctium lappa]
MDIYRFSTLLFELDTLPNDPLTKSMLQSTHLQPLNGLVNRRLGFNPFGWVQKSFSEKRGVSEAEGYISFFLAFLFSRVALRRDFKRVKSAADTMKKHN